MLIFLEILYYPFNPGAICMTLPVTSFTKIHLGNPKAGMEQTRINFIFECSFLPCSLYSVLCKIHCLKEQWKWTLCPCAYKCTRYHPTQKLFEPKSTVFSTELSISIASLRTGQVEQGFEVST